ncbi:MAG TPA: tetratricopeptide repeat protein [Polyangia bacterium]|jgi:hypothetical protein|nr:tetratricopeptide repeat protein [Polyangia bacterium]
MPKLCLESSARRLRNLVVALCLAFVAISSRDARAAAPDDEAIAKVVELNREGVAQFEKKHYDAARKALKQALELCASAGLDHHPVAARTHIHLGIVIVAGYGQREIGARQFNEALEIDPNIALTPGLATPVVEDVFNETVLAVSPKSATRVSAPEASAEEAPPADGEAPAQRAPARRASAAETGDDAPGLTRRAADDDEEGEAAGRASSIQLAALLGGGAGWASGKGDLNADTPVAGSFAAAKLGHLALSGGYWLTNELMLGLEGRFQKVTGTTDIHADNRTYEPATYATAVFATGTWSPSGGRLRPYLSAAVGAGKIRHVVTLSSLKDCGPNRNEVCVDTVGAGPFLAGVGGGLTFDLGDRLALVAALNTQIGAPTFTFNIDLNAGVAFRL